MSSPDRPTRRAGLLAPLIVQESGETAARAHDQPHFPWPFALHLLTAFLGYSLIFLGLHPVVGQAIGTLQIVPVALFAWRYGLRWGMALAVLLSLWQFTVLSRLVGEGLLEALQNWGWTSAMAALFTGAVVGRLRELGDQWRRELVERRRAEQALLEVYEELEARVARRTAELEASERQYRILMEQASDAVFLSDRNGRFIAVNDRACEMLGYSRPELLRLSIPDLALEDNPEQLAQRRQELAAGRIVVSQRELRRKDGTHFTAEVSARLLSDGRLQAAARDITERLHLEAQLRQAQKMEAVGRLAGGVAHDFNNLLTVIAGFNELLMESLTADDPRRSYAEEINSATERAAELTGQLLTFGRKQLVTRRVVDLNESVRQAVKMLRRVIGEDIVLEVRLAGEPVSTRADPHQLQQVILNLAINARDAMPSGGKLSITTEHVELSPAHHPPGFDGRPGDYVLLSVADTGTGISPQVRSHLFEPFFTTKEVGKGTGLGLAIVYAIVKQAEGHIDVESEEGQGAAFHIYLPQQEPQQEPQPAEATPAMSQHGHETVLLVEDETPVRSYASQVLRRAGYTVLQASSGAEALQVSARHRGELHLLVTDVVMPGMSGRELAERLSELRAGLGVLYLSGYTDDAVLRHGVVAEEVLLLQKPFNSKTLLAKVREALEHGEQGERREARGEGREAQKA